MYYKLDDTIPVAVEDPLEWAMWMETADRTVKLTELPRDLTGSDGLVRVSTVFLGLDHNFLGDGPPLLFETLVFDGGYGGDMERYPTWELAEVGHNEMVKELEWSYEQDRKEGYVS